MDYRIPRARVCSFHLRILDLVSNLFRVFQSGSDVGIDEDCGFLTSKW